MKNLGVAMAGSGGSRVENESLGTRVLAGDCRVVLPTLDAGSVDSVVTDPPYNLASIVRRFGVEGAAPAAPGVYGRSSAGFMGKKWDSDVAFASSTWAAVFRVLKPGGHLLAFGGTRTYHRLVCAIEDAGFEIRDQIGWAYGSGFPKSHDVAKAIDKHLGVVGEFGAPKSEAHAGWISRGRMRGDEGHDGYQRPWTQDEDAVDRNARRYIPGAAEAAQWQGWGTALKPAWEPICIARKPLIGTVAENVLAHGAGALNIDGCRVETSDNLNGGAYATVGGRATLPGEERVGAAAGMWQAGKTVGRAYLQPTGRWPANLVHDGSDEVMGAFPASKGGGDIHRRSSPKTAGVYGNFAGDDDWWSGYRDTGSAARFFYCAKASRSERGASNVHPTVKPVALMRWLCRLVTPPGGIVLDPFAGSGTTGLAAREEGFRSILVEQDASYAATIRERLGIADDPMSHLADLL